MLQRAASNAYSWWWASHVRTKQSKWLEQSLIDMEDKVQHVLKLIEEDGDSFAKRAEMYYKKRPELVFFVEDSYRAYRALAERYDHISTELQNANNTIASIFPERVQFEMDDEDDFSFPKGPKNLQRSPLRDNNHLPKAPETPPPARPRPVKGVLASASENLKPNKAEGRSRRRAVNSVEKSGLVKEQALEEIDGLQKEVLALQTVKEFVKSSYENGLAKFWEIEKQIEAKQDRVFTLQEEFSIGKVIEDDDARTLMAEAALQSCQDTLTRLEEEQEKSAQEAVNEKERVHDASKRIESLKDELLPKEDASENKRVHDTIKRMESLKHEPRPKEVNLREKIKEHFEATPVASSSDNTPFTISYLAERIDNLVTKVISLETVVSSQTGLLDRFKTETDNLHAQIHILENDKANLTNDVNTLKEQLREMEEKLRSLQDLNKKFENENSHLKTHFTQARHSLDNLSEKLQTMKPDEDPEEVDNSPFEVKFETTPEDKQVVLDQKQIEEEEEENMATTIEPNEPRVEENQKIEDFNEEPNWHEMLLSGVEDREKIILKEYTLILRNYKEIKRQLGNVEDRSVIHIKELRGVVADRDQEIRNLTQKMNLMRENNPNGIEEEPKDDPTDDDDKQRIRSANPFLMNEEDLIKWVLTDRYPAVSMLEKKLRMKIDRLLDENLDFWLRFSSQYQQVEKFRTGFHDLQAEVLKLKSQNPEEREWDIKSDIRPIYSHMREIQKELIVWLEQSTSLKEELRRRFSSLCDIEEEISTAFKVDAREGVRLTSHQAAKLQGEVLTMKQENHKIKDELISGLDHITELQIELEKTVAELDDDYELSGPKKDVEAAFKNLPSRTRIPLRAFIFGSKPKKKNSLFSFVSHKQFNELKKAGNL